MKLLGIEVQFDPADVEDLDRLVKSQRIIQKGLEAEKNMTDGVAMARHSIQVTRKALDNLAYKGFCDDAGLSKTNYMEMLRAYKQIHQEIVAEQDRQKDELDELQAFATNGPKIVKPEGNV